MNLWVRSQNKECLTNISNIQYIYKNNMHGLGTYYDNLKILGTYKTKERALEILDEIQNILKPKYILDSSSIRPDGDSWVENGVIFQKYNANARIEELSTFVYQMPKD